MIYCFILFCVLFCSGFSSEVNFKEKYGLSETAYNYLQEVLSYIEQGSVYKERIDFSDLQSQVYEKAWGAKRIPDVYPAVELAVKLLNDRHSFFLRPEHLKTLEKPQESIQMGNHKKALLQGEIGYVLVPFCHTFSIEVIEKYALTLQQQILDLDVHKLNKWIVDLRGNSGGNMYPMLLGLRSLIGEGIFGFFSDGLTEFVPWSYRDSSVLIGEDGVFPLSIFPCKLANTNPWIVVLIDEKTASSAEVVTVAFLGREKVRIFGQKTCGLTTANEFITCSDGSALLLASAYYADRLKRIYKEGVVPDKVVSKEEDILQEAILWLQDVPLM